MKNLDNYTRPDQTLDYYERPSKKLTSNGKGNTLIVSEDFVSAQTYGDDAHIVVKEGSKTSLNTNGKCSHISVLSPFNSGTTHGIGSRVSSLADKVYLRTMEPYAHAVGAGNHNKLETFGEKAHAINAGKKGISKVSGLDSIACVLGYGGVVQGNDYTNAIVLQWHDELSNRPRVTVGYVGEFHRESNLLIEPNVEYTLDKQGRFIKTEKKTSLMNEAFEEDSNDNKYNQEDLNLSNFEYKQRSLEEKGGRKFRGRVFGSNN